MFLTPADLTDLTGYKTRAGQRSWLADRGWRFEVDRFGNPKVLIAERDRRMLGGSGAKARQLGRVA